MEPRSAFAKPVALSNIARDIGQVFFASMFVGPIAGNVFNTPLVASGIMLSAIFWLTSLFLAKE